MIDFKKYEGSAVLADLGTVASQIGTKGTIKFIPKNFVSTELNKKGERIRVVLLAKDNAGNSAIISCSKALSAYLRKAREEGSSSDELLAGLLDLNVMEGEEGTPFITMPAGAQTEGKTA